MRDSFAIGRVFGIQIRVHFLFPLILAFVLLQALSVSGATWQDASFALVLVFMLFGIVFLHELGHSLVARRFGIRVLDMMQMRGLTLVLLLGKWVIIGG